VKRLAKRGLLVATNSTRAAALLTGDLLEPGNAQDTLRRINPTGSVALGTRLRLRFLTVWLPRHGRQGSRYAASGTARARASACDKRASMVMSA